MEIVVCGVRGSTPAPGERFVRVGGNTSCLAVRAPGGRWLVLDAGTGFRRMADVLDGAPFCGSVLLTHLHWDHTQGLPFLANADRSDAEVHLHLPEQEGRGAADVLARAMSPPHFPIRPEELVGSWTFEFMAPGVHLIEGLEVTAAEITHKGGRTFGYRISDGERAIAYLPDHAPTIAGTEALERRCRPGLGSRSPVPRFAVHRPRAVQGRRVRALHHQRCDRLRGAGRGRSAGVVPPCSRPVRRRGVRSRSVARGCGRAGVGRVRGRAHHGGTGPVRVSAPPLTHR